MPQTIQKWGNSLALRIPKPIAEQLDFQNGTEIEISSADGALVIRPRAKRKRRKYDLEEMLSRITPENTHEAVEFGPPVGNEVI